MSFKLIELNNGVLIVNKDNLNKVLKQVPTNVPIKKVGIVGPFR
jgi:hypothetical protein